MAYTAIPENRDTNRSEEALITELETLSFAEEIERDKNRAKVLLERGARAKEALAASNNSSAEDRAIMAQEVESANVYKRALLLIGASGTTVTNGDKTKNVSENNLPASTYLAHGARCLIQIPAGSNDDLINWLTSGKKDTNGRSESQDHNEAMREGRYVYNRSAATHDVSVTKGKVKEEKGFLIGVRDFLASKFGKKTNHYGVDLACDAEFGGVDSRGKPVKKPDGDHGHLYIHYKPATATEPGSILFGLEGAAPRSSKHSKIGASDPISPTGCSKWEDLNKKKKYSAESEYSTTIVPQKYNGLHATLTQENMSAIVEQDTESFGSDLATAIPQASLASFTEQTKQHKTPKLQAPKELSPVPEPSWWQKFTNTITFGLAYKQECADYEKYTQYNKIATRYNAELSLSTKPPQRHHRAIPSATLTPDAPLPKKKSPSGRSIP